MASRDSNQDFLLEKLLPSPQPRDHSLKKNRLQKYTEIKRPH